MPYHINGLSRREVQMIISALSITQPFGGGSDEMQLLIKIGNTTDVPEDYDLTMRYAKKVVNDYMDSAGLPAAFAEA